MNNNYLECCEGKIVIEKKELIEITFIGRDYEFQLTLFSAGVKDLLFPLLTISWHDFGDKINSDVLNICSCWKDGLLYIYNGNSFSRKKIILNKDQANKLKKMLLEIIKKD